MVNNNEVKFLKAEAYLIKENKTMAATSYNNGVKASVKWATGTDAPAALVSNMASKAAADIDLETIMLGKYDAMFTSVEVWNDWRRTGYPVLTPNPDPLANSNGIPYRFPSCISERTYNSNAVIVSSLYEKPWFAE